LLVILLTFTVRWKECSGSERQNQSFTAPLEWLYYLYMIGSIGFTLFFGLGVSVSVVGLYYGFVLLVLNPYFSEKLLKIRKPHIRQSLKQLNSVLSGGISIVQVRRILKYLFYNWLLVVVIIVGSALYYNKEPFSLTDGISIWPTECIRLIAVFFAYYLLKRSWRKIKECNDATESIQIGESSDQEGRVVDNDSIISLWHHYRDGGDGMMRFNRVKRLAWVWWVMCTLIVLFQAPNIPFRGGAAYVMDLLITGMAVAAFISLFVFAVDATLQCRQFIQKLIDVDTCWSPMDTKEGKILECKHHFVCDIKWEWRKIHLIAACTNHVSQTIYYPIYVILLLLIALNPYFDNWDMPYTLMMVAVLNIGICLYYGFSLHRKAIKAREVSLEKIIVIESKVFATPSKVVRKSIMRELKFYRKRIEAVHDGAFLPISEQPWLRAFALMFSGGGSLLFFEFLAG